MYYSVRESCQIPNKSPTAGIAAAEWTRLDRSTYSNNKYFGANRISPGRHGVSRRS